MATVSHAHRHRTAHFLRSAAITASLVETTLPFDPCNEDVPYTPEPWQAVAPVRPDTAHVRALRFHDGVGEAVSAFILIVGGVGITGYASLVGGLA